MNLEEQFKKETGKYHFMEIEVSGVLIDVISHDYINWLKEKLTWKKFDGNVDGFPFLLGFNKTGLVLFVEDEEELEQIIDDGDFEGACYQEIIPPSNNDI